MGEALKTTVYILNRVSTKATTKTPYVKPGKNSIFLKKGKTVICRYSTGEKSGNFINIG